MIHMAAFVLQHAWVSIWLVSAGQITQNEVSQKYTRAARKKYSKGQ